MADQSELDADVQAVEADVAALNDATANIAAELDALKTANPALDLSGLNTAVADLGTALAGVAALKTADAPPAPGELPAP